MRDPLAISVERVGNGEQIESLLPNLPHLWSAVVDCAGDAAFLPARAGEGGVCLERSRHLGGGEANRGEGQLGRGVGVRWGELRPGGTGQQLRQLTNTEG